LAAVGLSPPATAEESSVAEEKKRRLEQTIGGLRRQYGLRIIRPLKEQAAEVGPPLATGFAPLDRALVGGLPSGRVVEIVTIPTAGGASLALRILASAQGQGLVAYVDPERAFNPTYAAHSGVATDRLLLVQPRSYRQGLEIAQDLILNGDGRLVLVDAPYNLFAQGSAADRLAQMLHRVNMPLRHSGAILLFLVSLPPASDKAAALARPIHDTLAHYAATRLVVCLERWRRSKEGIAGYNATIHLLKPRQRQLTMAVSLDPESY
jgi:hypothetical protein